MKNVLNGFLATALLVTTFTACKKDIEPPAQNNTDTPAALAKADRIPSAMYKLTRVGNDSLIYGNDGRLVKVQHNAISLTEYSYSFNYITAKTYESSVLTKKIIYQIDLPTGRVLESAEHLYSYPSPNVTIHDQKWFKFEYDANGYIKQKYNKYFAFERSYFSWSADGNLANVYFHDEYNEILHSYHFGYHTDTDKLQLQPARTGLDPYLKIFGKGSKNMVRYEQRYPSGSNTPNLNENLYYQLNASGYPTSCTIYNAFTNKRIGSFKYKYL